MGAYDVVGEEGYRLGLAREKMLGCSFSGNRLGWGFGLILPSKELHGGWDFVGLMEHLIEYTRGRYFFHSTTLEVEQLEPAVRLRW